MHGDLCARKCFQGIDQYGYVEDCGWREEGHTEDFPNIPDEGEVPRESILKCPSCKIGMQRPGVVWFGENLDGAMMRRIQDWLENVTEDGLCLVVGTSGKVFPAAAFSRMVKDKGGKVAVVDMEDRGEEEGADWNFVGDAAVIVPEILKPIIEGWEQPSILT